jgi:hypothetical protein
LPARPSRRPRRVIVTIGAGGAGLGDILAAMVRKWKSGRWSKFVAALCVTGQARIHSLVQGILSPLSEKRRRQPHLCIPLGLDKSHWSPLLHFSSSQSYICTAYHHGSENWP